MRIAGILMLFSSFSLIGFLFSARLHLRERKLSEAIRYIERIDEEMRGIGDELPRILSRIEGEIYIKNGSWHGTEGLKKQDLKVLSSFLSLLGKTDICGQKKNAATHISLLSDSLAEAKKEKFERSRLYVSLGVLGGAFVCILLV